MSSSNFRTLGRLVGWFLFVPSGLATLGLLWFLGSSLNLWNATERVEGRVVAHEEVRLKRGQGRKSIVEFALPDGRTVRAVDPVVRQNAAVHKLGERVTVDYSIEQPEHAQIAGSVIVQVLIGGALLVLSLVGMLIGWLLLRLRPPMPSG